MFWGAGASRGDSCSNYVSVELTAPKYEIGKMYSTFLTVGGWNNANMETEPGNSIINCCLVLRGESDELVNSKQKCLISPSQGPHHTLNTKHTRELSIILFITII